MLASAKRNLSVAALNALVDHTRGKAPYKPPFQV